MKLYEITENKPTLYVPIGPSGSGKSTYLKKLLRHNPDINVFSLDLLRHEFYHPTDYRKAWQLSVDDKDFNKKANRRFLELLNDRKNLYVDNTNVTPKSRRYYIEAAKRAGYKTVALLFNVDLDTLIARQTTRSDKTVPEEAVRKQYNALVYPTMQGGEFDEIVEV